MSSSHIHYSENFSDCGEGRSRRDKDIRLFGGSQGECLANVPLTGAWRWTKLYQLEGFCIFFIKQNSRTADRATANLIQASFMAVHRTSREPTELRIYEGGNQECVSNDLMAEVQLFQGISVEQMSLPDFTSWNHVNGFPNHR